MPEKAPEVFKLLAPENIGKDFSEADLLEMGLPMDAVERLGSMATGKPSEVLGETVSPEEKAAADQKELEELQSVLQARPQPGGLG
jgi:hypothetical protein